MHKIHIQIASIDKAIPTRALIRKWAKAALNTEHKDAEISLRMIDKDEMQDLNFRYRQKNYATNVLSFPSRMPEISGVPNFLGDIAICTSVVNEEALAQQISSESHWAHMIVHGIFHLMGYDHEEEHDAEIMEPLEIQTLHTLGFANPYER